MGGDPLRQALPASAFTGNTYLPLILQASKRSTTVKEVLLAPFTPCVFYTTRGYQISIIIGRIQDLNTGLQVAYGLYPIMTWVIRPIPPYADLPALHATNGKHQPSLLSIITGDQIRGPLIRVKKQK